MNTVRLLLVTLLLAGHIATSPITNSIVEVASGEATKEPIGDDSN